MFTEVTESLRSVRVVLVVAVAGASVATTAVGARGAIVMSDDFTSDTSANWTQVSGNVPPSFAPASSRLTISGTPARLEHNVAFNASAGNTTIATTMISIAGFQQDTAIVSGIASNPYGGFIAVRAYAAARTVSLTTSGGDFNLTTLAAFNVPGATLTLNLFPATLQYEVLVSGASTTSYDSGLRSLSTDVPAFSFGSLGSNASALLGSDAANTSGSTRGVNIDSITITQTVPAPAAVPALALGAVALRRRRRVA